MESFSFFNEDEDEDNDVFGDRFLSSLEVGVEDSIDLFSVCFFSMGCLVLDIVLVWYLYYCSCFLLKLGIFGFL